MTSVPPPPSRWRALGRCLPLLGLLSACSPVDDAPPPAPHALGRAARALGSTLLVGPETPASASAAAGPQEQSVVASGAGMYFIVWVQNSEQDPPDLRGMRIRASDGVPLDASPLVLSSDFIERRPSVVFDGANFLVSWLTPEGYLSSRGVRVRASDGVVLDSTPRWITSFDPFIQTPATVTFDGTNYVAVFRGLIVNSEDNTYAFQAMAHRIRPSDGAILDSPSFQLGVVDENAAAHHAASRDGITLAVWTNGGVRAARLDSTGQVLDTTPLTVSSVTANTVRVAARPGEFLVVWNEGSDLKARRVRASDGALLDASALSVGASAELLGVGHWPEVPFDVTFDGQDYRVLWQSTSPARQLRTTRVAADGTIGTAAQDTLATFGASTSPDWVGLAAQGPGSFLVTYSQQDPASGQSRIQFRRVSPNDCEHDVTPPTVTCPATLLKQCTFSGQDLVPDTDFTDNCGLSNVGNSPEYYGAPRTFTSWVSATDLSGNSASCSTEWTVVDTLKPDLYLSGPSSITLRYGEPYQEYGAYGDDQCDGYYMYNRVQIYGTVNSWQPGYYGITYVLTDYAGNTSEAIRFVEVLGW